MNRNVESHFSVAPSSLDVRRSKFDRSHSHKFSANAGQIIPVYWDEVLPGDTVSMETSKIVRLQTLVHPIMDNIYMDTYWFFVPMRLVWEHTKEFFGESPKAWMPDVEYNIPRLRITPDHYPRTGSLADYMGLAPQIRAFGPTTDHPEDGVNALPFRAYAAVMRDWFRDENLMDSPVIDMGDATQTMNDPTDDDLYCALGGPVYRASKYHDYYTSALPRAQRGEAVTLNPLQDFVPVGAGTGFHNGYVGDTAVPMLWTSGYTAPSASANILTGASASSDNNPAVFNRYGSPESIPGNVYPRNLYADLRDSFALTIADLRTAFQVQKFMEAAARNGSRYIEIIKGMFGVTSPDARLQRTEYLGGNRIALNVHEVTNNSQSEQGFLGDLGAMSRTVDTHGDFTHSFTEHGYLLGVSVVRYDHTYGQGIEKKWTRFTKFDFYWPMFANLSERPILRSELWFNNVDPEFNHEVFGYQEAWAEYRYSPNTCAGEMRPGIQNSLASWHLADLYDDKHVPYLSAEWIREDPTQLDRCLAVTSDVSNQYFADFYFKSYWTRVMPVYSIPGLIDHH